MKCQISEQYERQRARPRRSPKIQPFSLFVEQVATQDWGACVPTKSSGVMTCLARAMWGVLNRTRGQEKNE